MPGREDDVFGPVLESIEKGSVLPIHGIDTECELKIVVGGFDSESLRVECTCTGTPTCNGTPDDRRQKAFHGDARLVEIADWSRIRTNIRIGSVYGRQVNLNHSLRFEYVLYDKFRRDPKLEGVRWLSA